MALPTRSDVQTLDFSGYGQPAAYLEAKTLSPSSYTLDYSGYAQPVVGLASTAAGYSITASNGSYSLSGQTATLVKTRVLSAQAGSYSISGQIAALSLSRLISAQNGVYSVAGNTANIVYSGGPTPVTELDIFVEIRSFTERRRFS